ncbi:hypothetical protein PILCRDRAFT_643933 [Piloderma croceum F 1598]|uniref:DUF6534 domain-containing protein n=1 Tax=Piloderma croceum (strain F 1598) TaxID=765440 RepID=A0A0C3F931_PILCF|nr:hypothetical protein PILCRDRAFT_643933 [Piloderma croceum F 1598]
MLNGFTVSLMLYGVTCCQTIQYYRFFPADRRSFKLLVAFIWLLDTAQQALLTQAFWYYLIVLRYTKDTEAAYQANWSLIGQVAPTEICAMIVECFFISRICILDARRRRILLLLIPLTFSFFIFIVYIVKCYKLPDFVSATRMQWLVGMLGSLRAVIDLTIAGAMCHILYSHCPSDLTQRFSSLVKILMHYALTTGLFTSVLETLYVVVYLAMPSNMIYIAIYFVHGKIYVNSLLAALNSRKSLRALAEQDIELQPVRFSLFQDVNLPHSHIH